MRVRVYLAGPLFSQAEIRWGLEVKKAIQEALPGAEVVWPHETASLDRIFASNLEALQSCSLMVAILDGTQVDDGTAFEVGYHYACRGPWVVGIRTDFRKAGETEKARVNAMIEGACRGIAGSLDELKSLLKSLGESLHKSQHESRHESNHRSHHEPLSPAPGEG
ncbi:MAG: nucleoside 2-deoxyribosyltransferase [Methanosarcinales archaeon]|nr:nucleoside 2-deoxyribosyltransferase [Methanosarcinales archaeon]